ncbi:PhoH family protein [Rhizobium lentis]|uniref:PhoH family protein n=1 Tax=Rhizobium lentis TaxID=1138194 RepID=UPI001C83265B|nr:PhoH family protein [Rhizobium lentis]MBX5130843.1 PhoH family protein [Rhizobium lentis]
MSQARRSSKSTQRQERRGARVRPDQHVNLLAAVIEEQTNRRKPSRTSKHEGPVKALNDGQRRYDAAMRSSDIVFGNGPAGTGKTWLAVQRAAEALNAGVIDKIYVSRPNVEVERSFGFLTGDLKEKFKPYLVPLEEAFHDAFGQAKYEYLVEAEIIVPVPLAFMRGRTLKKAWVIFDEMQNATDTEFKMALTRIGEGAKFIINGDLRQIDRGIASGMARAMNLLGRLPEVSIVEFGREDIVRHGLIQKIVELYEDQHISSYSASEDKEAREGLERFLDATAPRN